MSREHARITKGVINLDSWEKRHIVCAWDTCEKMGFDLHRVQVNYGTADYPQVVKYIFCTERHKMYWVNSHRSNGNLPPGYKRSCI